MENHNSKLWRQLSQELSEAIRRAGESIVSVMGHRGHASSGIVWRPDVVITAAHAVRHDSTLRVIGSSGDPVSARIAGRDHGSDIAVLQLNEGLSSPVAEFGETESAAVGELVVAIARTRRGHIVASTGVIGGLMGEWRAWGVRRIDQFIRPDLTLLSGFSGGALIGADGRILGMNTSALMRDKPITIPAATLVRIGTDLASKGRVPRPHIGVVMQPVHLPESLQTRSGIAASGGLLVMQTQPGGPADQAGVLIGDILVQWNGQGIGELENLSDLVSGSGIGNEASLTLIRGGLKHELAVRVGER